MDVKQAVQIRSSIRSFTQKPISNKLIKDLLKISSKAPSGGNLQPWRVFVLNKKSMKSFLDFQSKWTKQEVPGYDIYPPSLKEPYRTERFKVGKEMYSILGIDYEDKQARLDQVMKNFTFFDAPAAIFCFIDKDMGPPQWSDLGMFLQTFMLLACEAGLSTCAQEAWSLKHECVSKFCKSDENLMLFCGMAIGYGDLDAPINSLKTTRLPLEEWTTFI